MPTYVKIIGWCIFVLAIVDIIRFITTFRYIIREERRTGLTLSMTSSAMQLLIFDIVYIIGWFIAVWEYAA